MKVVKPLQGLALLAIVGACSTSISHEATARAQACPPPRFEVSNFGAEADRGWPGGVSVADVNDDGALDIYITSGYDYVDGEIPRPGRSMLYLNDGHGQFRRAEDNPISNDSSYASGSTWADIDHDGDLDAFVSTELGQADAFYRNRGAGQMVREPLGEATTTRGGNYGASWADIDGDGDQDILVDGPGLEPPGPNLVYRNDSGAFSRVTGVAIENGVSNATTSQWADLDNDGRADLIVANNDLWRLRSFPPGPGENESAVLYFNRGNWNFERAQNSALNNHPASTAAIGDIDNDGDLDIFLGVYTYNVSRRDHLLINDGRGVFAEAADFVTAAHDQPTLGAAFADFNGDGNLDLIYAEWTGAITLMTGDGAGHLVRIADPELAARVTSHSSLAVGDFDNDGLPDVIIGNWTEAHEGQFATMLHNVSAPCGDWVNVALRDKYGAPNPPGARVTLVSRDSSGHERRQLREAAAQSGFRSQSASFFLFGVPRGERIMRAEIRWPNGRTETVRTLPVNRSTAIREPIATGQ